MEMSNEPLNDTTLDEVISFFREVNPAAQKAWGWDTGRFIDWRWASNTLRERATPGWFSTHCRIFRDGATIRAVAIAEEGGAATCIITRDEEPAVVGAVLEWLVADRAAKGVGLSFEFSDRAEWLRSVFRDAGLTEEVNTGCEWEYDLRAVPAVSALPDGYTVESLTDDRDEDYAGIAACIKAAFNAEHDVVSSLRSLERNPLFRPELSVFVRSPDGRIAAYCRGTVDAANGVCGIDPVCTHPDFSRLGLATAVIHECFRRQRDLGGRFSYIGSAAEPAPSTRLYRSLGPVDQTVCCVWSLPVATSGG